MDFIHPPFTNVLYTDNNSVLGYILVYVLFYINISLNFIWSLYNVYSNKSEYLCISPVFPDNKYSSIS